MNERRETKSKVGVGNERSSERDDGSERYNCRV
jgi:hypothetical protein